jgi:hypothetical protein
MALFIVALCILYISCILPQYVSYVSKLCHGEARGALNCRMMYPCLGLLLVEWYVAPGGLLQVLSVVLHVVDLEQEKRESQARISGTRKKGESHKST